MRSGFYRVSLGFLVFLNLRTPAASIPKEKLKARPSIRNVLCFGVLWSAQCQCTVSEGRRCAACAGAWRGSEQEKL